MNNADNESSATIVVKYRHLLKTMKQASVGQIIVSGISPVFEAEAKCTVEWL